MCSSDLDGSISLEDGRASPWRVLPAQICAVCAPGRYYRYEVAQESQHCSNEQAQTIDAPNDPFATHNAAQRAAVGCTCDAPLLIIAGAGTGKTTTLAQRAHRTSTRTGS